LLEGKHQTVALIRNERTVSKQNLTTLDLGLRFFFDNRMGLRRPSTIEIKPQVRFGLGLSSDESAFTVFNLNGTYHTELNRLFDFDLKGRTLFASKRTPIFEQPSFGSEDTVRGFRRDDAIGRILWSVQPEIWLRMRGILSSPFDVVTGETNKLKKFVRDSVSFALFYDVGGVYRTTNSISGARSGAGAGLRFNYQRIAVFKLDWGYGIGDGLNGKGRGRFYFTVDLLENPF
jgi:hemolysin activation/secretion protein